MIDRLTDLEIPDAAKLQGIFHRVSKQFDELDHFYSWSKSIAITRSSEYPEVEQILQKKLDLLDEFIRDKLALRGIEKSPPEVMDEEVEEEKEPEPEEDMNAVKALPPPEPEPVEEEKEETKEEEVVETKVVQTEGDLLNLGEGAMTTEQHADNLALALFDGLGPATTAGSVPALTWQAFNDDNADWETALVQTSTTLTSQKAAMAGGFDMLMLDGMYQQGENVAAASVYRPTGSASSVAFGSAGTPAMLALPAPPSAEGKATGTTVTDPFAGSLSVAPPPFVQMSDMEKKQRLLEEEQMMWEKYRADGLQGHLGMMRQHQQYPYNTTGGY